MAINRPTAANIFTFGRRLDQGGTRMSASRAYRKPGNDSQPQQQQQQQQLLQQQLQKPNLT